MKVFEVEMDKLFVPENSRNYDHMDIEVMERAIEIAGGLLSPLVVLANSTTGKYKILDGARRYEALKKMGYSTAPCVIAGIPENVRVALQLTEAKRK